MYRPNLMLQNSSLYVSVDQSYSWEANNCSASQYISCLLWNPYCSLYYRVYLIHINSVHIVTLYFFIHFSIIFPFTTRTPKWLFNSHVSTKTLYRFLIASVRATCPLVYFLSYPTVLFAKCVVFKGVNTLIVQLSFYLLFILRRLDWNEQNKCILPRFFIPYTLDYRASLPQGRGTPWNTRFLVLEGKTARNNAGRKWTWAWWQWTESYGERLYQS
jgi:hypothetical protein